MSSSPTQPFGSFVRRCREEAGLTQAQVARKIGYSTHKYGAIERGTRQTLPLLSEVQSWSATLKVGADELARAWEAAAGGEAGTTKIWKDLPADLFDEIGTSDGSVVVWQTWLPNDLRVARALVRAVERGAQVRCLVLDPSCDYVKERAVALRFHESYPEEQLSGLLSAIHGRGDGDPQDLVRFTSSPPVAQVYATDVRMFVGWFFPSEPSTVMPQLEVGLSSYLAKELLKQFDQEWESAPPSTNRSGRLPANRTRN
jgi:transcriptional regulator with XRE-family HTH domain